MRELIAEPLTLVRKIASSHTKEAFFEQAIMFDSHYALAYAGLTRTYQFIGTCSFTV